MSPILSSVKWSTILLTIIFALSSLLGSTSLASIELLMSMAMMVSIPLRFSWVMRVPSCGLASMSMSNRSTVWSNQNFTSGLTLDTSTDNFFIISGCAKRRSRLRRCRATQYLTMAIMGMVSSRYKYIGSANLISLFLILYYIKYVFNLALFQYAWLSIMDICAAMWSAAGGIAPAVVLRQVQRVDKHHIFCCIASL